MTQRTEGLVTYTEETRVTRAAIHREGLTEPLAVVAPDLLLPDQIAIKVSSVLTRPEARALRDAITVMLGDGAKPCGEECDDIAAMQKLAQRWAGERIIARLEKRFSKYAVLALAKEVQNTIRDEVIAIVREECGVAE